MHCEKLMSLSVCGRFQNGRREAQVETRVGRVDEISGETNTSVRSSLHGVHAA